MMRKLNISYARQSFKRTETDSSVIWQKQLISEYAAKQGYRLDAHFDDIKSGNRTDRSGLLEVQRLINNEKVVSLTVYRIDRIYRNYRQSLEFFQLCAEKEIVLHSVEDGTFNFQKPEERLALQVLSATAENQREQSVQQRKMNNKRKFESGLPVNYEAPFGYRYKDHRFVLEPIEAQTVEFVFNSYISGQGYKKISGLTKTVPWVYRSPAQIKNIIINPKYYGDFTGIHGTLKNFLPAIVSQDLFEHAQAIRQRRAEDRRSTGTVKAYLRTKIICPYCSSKLTPHHNKSQKNSTAKYVCQKRLSGHYNDCLLKAVNLKTLEHHVQMSVIRLLSSPDEIRKLSDRVRHELSNRQAEQVQKGKSFSNFKQVKVDQLAKGEISVLEFKQWLDDHVNKLDRTVPDLKVNTAEVKKLLQVDMRVKQEIFDLVEKVHINTDGKPTDIRIKGLNKNILKFTGEETVL